MQVIFILKVPRQHEQKKVQQQQQRKTSNRKPESVVKYKNSRRTGFFCRETVRKATQTLLTNSRGKQLNALSPVNMR